MLPEQLAVTVQGHHQPGSGFEVDVARLRIDHRRTNRVTVVSGVADIIAETILPKLRPRLYVEADERFLDVTRLAVEPEGIHATIRDHRRARAFHLIRPTMVGSTHLEFVREFDAGLGYAVLVGSAPVQPAGRGMDGADTDATCQRDEERNETRSESHGTKWERTRGG